jgi:importin subunit alpha-1
VREVVSAGALPLLVARLSSGEAKVVFEAAWALTNVAASESSATAAVAAAGALAPLAAGAMHADAAVRDQCLWCLGNIAGDAAALRDAVLGTAGALDALLTNLRHPETLKLLQNATWVLSNFCRGSPPPAAAHAAAMLPALAALAALEDGPTAADALWGLSFLFDGDERAAAAALAAAPGLAARAVALMAHADGALALPALRIVGALTAGSEALTQAAVDAGALAGLVPLLGSARRAIRREACWAISNVAAGAPAQIGAVIATRGLLPAVLDAMAGGEWHVRKEATWVICNAAAAGTATHVCALVAAGVVEPLVGVLAAAPDERILTVVLDAIAAILAVEARLKAEENPAAAMCRFAEKFEEHGLISRLEELQNHASTDVYEKSYRLLTAHYGDDDAGDGAEPAAAADNTHHATSKTIAAAAPAHAFSFTGMQFA